MRIRTGLAVLMTAASCLLASQVQAQDQKEPKKIKPQRDLVTRDEIMASNQREESLAAALRNLRPRMLQAPPGVRSMGNALQVPTLVVVDGKKMGSLDVLESIVASSVAEVRYYDPSKAGMEYGSEAASGAVVVKTWSPEKGKKVVKDTTP